MAENKKQALWVIFDGPQQHGGPGTRYIAYDGTSTEYRREAAKFYTSQDARSFADKKGITIDGAMKYIQQESFSDFDMQR